MPTRSVSRVAGARQPSAAKPGAETPPPTAATLGELAYTAHLASPVVSGFEERLSATMDSTFVPLAQTSVALTATPTPEPALMQDTTEVRARTPPTSRQSTARSTRDCSPAPESQPAFAWTPRAAAELLRLRFVTMKHRFQGNKSPKQLAAAWKLIAAETYRLGGLDADPGQCKSKIKHMHKQYTAYRVALQDTGNSTERQLKEPPCYAMMCDVWGDHEGMDADPFFSSDDPLNEGSSSEGTLAGIVEASEEHNTHADDTVESSGNEVNSAASGGSWRRYSGKRDREKAETAAGMRAIGEGLHSIVEAFKVSRAQTGDVHSQELVSSIRELTQTVQAQTQALNNLLQHVAAGLPNNTLDN